MITAETTAENIGPCLGPYGTRRTFYLDGVRVILHDLTMDNQLRWLIDQGMSLENAYRQIGMWDDIPPPGMQRCCYDVLRTKWFDPISGTWKRSGWGHTCAGYFHCFEDYIEALRETKKRGRIKIATGVYVPSPEEEKCIKLRFHASNDIVRAYSECDAIDILPTFPGAIEGLGKLMRTTIAVSMYEMIKTLHAFASPPEEHAPPGQHHALPDDKQEPNYWLYGAVAAGALILLTR